MKSRFDVLRRYTDFVCGWHVRPCRALSRWISCRLENFSLSGFGFAGASLQLSGDSGSCTGRRIRHFERELVCMCLTQWPGSGAPTLPLAPAWRPLSRPLLKIRSQTPQLSRGRITAAFPAWSVLFFLLPLVEGGFSGTRLGLLAIALLHRWALCQSRARFGEARHSQASLEHFAQLIYRQPV